MCQKCHPVVSTVESVVESEQLPPFVIPFHSEEREYHFKGGEISANGATAIRTMLTQWTLRSFCGYVVKFRYSAEELETIVSDMGFAGYPNAQIVFDVLFSDIAGFPRSAGTDIVMQSGDTPEKEEVNKKRFYKQVARWLSDFEDGLGQSVPVLNDFRVVGNTVRDGKGQTFGKRLAKAISAHGTKLTKDQIETINNIATEHSTKAESLPFHFDNDYLEGDASDYGNSNSCWFEQNGSYSASRHTLHNAGGYAFKTRRIDGKITRVWIAPASDNAYVIFNHYGRHSLRHIAETLADTYGGVCTEVAFYNPQDRNGTLYVNRDTAFLIGRADVIAEMSGKDFKPDWDIIPDDSEPEYTCDDCRCGLDSDEVCSSENGGCYCELCYCENFTQCEACHSECSSSDCHDVTRFPGRRYRVSGQVCESCLRNAGWQECYACDEWHECSPCTDGNELLANPAETWEKLWEQCKAAACVTQYDASQMTITMRNGQSFQCESPQDGTAYIVHMRDTLSRTYPDSGLEYDLFGSPCGSIACGQAASIYNGQRSLSDCTTPQKATDIINLMLSGF